jgi:leader peptidase (prepilin peptidase)/N-methyltransferase
LVALVALWALVTGAGLNHLADRLPTRERVGAVPKCDHCATPRSPLSWISTVAYLTGRFRCPSCGAPISVRHPITELVTVLAWVSLYQSRGPTPYFLLGAFYACVFLLVLITDLEHRLILNVIILPAIVIALAGSFLSGPPTPQSAVIGGATGFLFFWLVALVGRGAMGAGDVKLAAFIGAVTGFPNVITALMIGIFAGGVVALILIVSRIRTVKSYIPYGPFLVFGGVLVTFFGPLIRQLFMTSY